jgi:CRP/FNR family transcriptional regulator, cyclic AMP receptor protein
MFKGKPSAKTEVIKNVSLFGLCSEKELADIAALTDELSVPAGSVLTKEGEPGRECFIVVSGTGQATLRDDVIGEIGPGEVIGEMALLDVSPRSATVTAKTDMELLVLDPRSFSDLLDRHPSVGKRMLATMARRLREVENAPTYKH